MKLQKLIAGLALSIAGSFGAMGTASAAAVICQDPNVNHMSIDSSIVAACLDAGVGNLTGNPANDLFLNGAGAGYELASKSDESNPFNIQFTQNGEFGTFSFDASAWGSYDTLAIAFKFGTGNTPDEWFVYLLNSLVSAGSWQFIPGTLEGNGGLSHVNLYGVPGGNQVPEPSALALLGFALATLALVRRRSRA